MPRPAGGWALPSYIPAKKLHKDTCSQIALGKPVKPEKQWLELNYSSNEDDSLKGKLKDRSINFKKSVMIHPSKTWQSRTWPFQRWQELTEKLLEKGVSVIAVGKSDPVIQRRLELENISMSPCPKGAINLIDQLSLLETVALLHQCNTLITFDSGLLHLGLSSPIKIVGMFSVVHPKFRLAWRKDGFTHNFISVDPKGDCTYCANGNDMGLTEFSTCPKAEFPPCLPGVDEVMEAYLKIQTRTFKTNDSVLEKGLKK